MSVEFKNPHNLTDIIDWYFAFCLHAGCDDGNITTFPQKPIKKDADTMIMTLEGKLPNNYYVNAHVAVFAECKNLLGKCSIDVTNATFQAGPSTE